MKPHIVLGIGCGLAMAAAVFFDAPRAVAFPRENQWHMPSFGETPQGNANRAGAGGIYGMGSPSDFGIRCADCHRDATASFQVVIDEEPDFLTSGNTKLYEPGQPYDITITIQNEQHVTAPSGGLTTNGFAATFEAPDGALMGTLVADNGSSASCPQNLPNAADPGPHNQTMIGVDCHGVLSEPEKGDTSWSFQWIAPAAGAGDVTMWYGVTDGDTPGESSLDDDTVQGSIALAEG